MKVSKNWLKEYLNLDNITDEELFASISAHICEIESYTKLVEATNLTIGYVKECVVHPNSDHLHICQVEVRPNEVKQIICGAPNVAAGKKVIVANVGAVLPGDFRIKPSKIRGVDSDGMLCSLQELGIEDKYVDEEFKNGIYLLDEEAPVGEDPLSYLGLDDTVIDLDLTSNRSDLLSIEGVAYDLGAALNQHIYPVAPEIEESNKKNPIEVEIKSDSCYKYLARTIENITIAPSPQWLKARLIASGIRPINNVVDITNYVLMELGQPLHAFDQSYLGSKIIVRNAYENEKLVTLDEVERNLLPSDLVIANEKEALCLAGVMGGLNSEVEPTTKTVVLEAAYFDPLSVRKTSARLGLKSESSMRFERKIDYDRVERALDYAAQLIMELAGGTILEGVARAVRKELPVQTVDITTEKVNHVLGTSLKDEEVEAIFKRLDYSYTKKDLVYTITLPSRRMDLEPSYQDIIEDVARMNGYDSIPTTIAVSDTKGGLTYKQKQIRYTRLLFAGMGLNETVSYSLVSKNDLNLYTLHEANPIEVMMPMTEDHAVMRQSLLNGILDAVSYNKARKVDHLAFFEIGNAYTKEEEILKLAGAISGTFYSEQWRGETKVADFYALKGLLDVYFNHMNISVVYKPYTELSHFHPGRTAAIYLEDKMIGVIGELHPRFAKDKGISGTVAFEIDLEPVLLYHHAFTYKPMNKFPTVTRDLAIVVKKDILADDVLNVIKQTLKSHLVGLEVFDLYTGDAVGEDEKSLAIKITLEDTTKTLESNDVDKMIHSVLNRLDYHFKARLRD
ncbi:MAG: phenylalanine--tRNA ligase subunit beta [Anaeroplasmataceae bacterium]|nr:phenylalanine--tRNA ligase subunit beta [Anaeroplasmataceae bacterium]